MVVVAIVVGAATGCAAPVTVPNASVTVPPSARPTLVAGSAAAPTAPSAIAPTSSRSVPMVAWHGPVEELFVHPLVLEPRSAFGSDSLGMGFQEYFVTALEFRRILDQLWRNGWTLVDVHRAAKGTVRVPAGRKPLVLSEDDVNYYQYFDGRGLAARLVLSHGRARAQLPDGRLTDEDVVPLVEAEVASHPEFSADGAKGVLALTGYEGLFGEHDLDQLAARTRVTALAQWLTARGWTLASHTWGHIDLSQSSVAEIAVDSAQWKALAQPLIGPTDVLVYPFGARPDGMGIRQLVQDGYTVQLDIDITARTLNTDGAVVMSRRHVDGYAFEAASRQAPLYDVATVRDPARPLGALP